MMKIILTSPEVFIQIFKEINAYLNWLVNLTHIKRKHRNCNQLKVFHVIHKLYTLSFS